MDLNHLLHRQQVERTRAQVANTHKAREAHEALAREYERQIEELSGEDFRVARPSASSAADAR